MAERHRGDLGGEACVAVDGIGQHRTWADRVDAHALDREGLRHGARRGPQGRFGQRVGEKAGVRPQHALVDQVDDAGIAAARPAREKGCGKQHRRAQVDREVSLEQREIGCRRGVGLEDGGVVDEQAQLGALVSACDEIRAGRGVREIGG